MRALLNALLVFELGIGGLRDLVMLTRISARQEPLNTSVQWGEIAVAHAGPKGFGTRRSLVAYRIEGQLDAVGIGRLYTARDRFAAHRDTSANQPLLARTVIVVHGVRLPRPPPS